MHVCKWMFYECFPHQVAFAAFAPHSQSFMAFACVSRFFNNLNCFLQSVHGWLTPSVFLEWYRAWDYPCVTQWSPVLGWTSVLPVLLLCWHRDRCVCMAPGTPHAPEKPARERELAPVARCTWACNLFLFFFPAMSQAVQTNGTQPLSKTWELSLYELQRTPQVIPAKELAFMVGLFLICFRTWSLMFKIFLFPWGVLTAYSKLDNI